MVQRRLSLLLVWTSFYDQLAWAPILVVLAAQAGDPAAVALAVSAYSLANLIGNVIFGFLADRLDRYRIAGAGLVAMAATALAQLAANTPALLIGARFFHGLSAATVAPAALAGLSAGVPGNRRGEVMARAGLVIAFASMVGPPLTGRLTVTYGIETAVLILAASLALVGVATLLFGGRGVERARAAGAVPGEQVAARGRASGAAEHLDLARAALAALVAFVLMFGQNVLFYALPLRNSELGLGPAVTGALFSAFAVGSVLAFVPPLSRAADRWGRFWPLLFGMALVAVGMGGLSWSVTPRQMAPSLFVYGLGFGLVFPAVSALMADAASSGRRGLAFGLLTAAFSAGSVTGPLVTRALASVAPPFTVTAILIAVGALVSAVWSRRLGPVVGPPSAR